MSERAPKADIWSAIRFNEIQTKIFAILLVFLAQKSYHSIDKDIDFKMNMELNSYDEYMRLILVVLKQVKYDM